MVGTIEFVVVLVFLYLFDGFRLARPGDRVFVAGWRGRFHLRRLNFYPGNGSWGWYVLNPLAPVGPAFRFSRQAYALTTDALLVLGPGGDSIASIPYGQCGSPSIRDGSTVLVQEIAIAVGSAAEALRAVELLRHLSAAAAEERHRTIEAQTSRQFDVRTLESRLAQFQNRTIWIRVFATTMFSLCFFAFPTILFMSDLSRALLAVGPAAFLLGLGSAIAYSRLADELLPELPKIDKFGNCVKLVLYPLSVIRSVELLSFHFLEGYDGRAGTLALSGKALAEEQARKEIQSLRYTANPADGDGLGAHRARLIAAVEDFCKVHGLALASLPPRDVQAGCVTYCPSCGTQYQLAAGFCADCEGVALLAIHPPRNEKRRTKKSQRRRR